jgi:hypothetical protein
MREGSDVISSSGDSRLPGTPLSSSPHLSPEKGATWWVWHVLSSRRGRAHPSASRASVGPYLYLAAALIMLTHSGPRLRPLFSLKCTFGLIRCFDQPCRRSSLILRVHVFTFSLPRLPLQVAIASPTHKDHTSSRPSPTSSLCATHGLGNPRALSFCDSGLCWLAPCSTPSLARLGRLSTISTNPHSATCTSTWTSASLFNYPIPG